MAFLNHSTSKIYKKQDLEKIKTLGFRGEALCSIAAVSKLLMISKTKKENLGCRILIENSKEIEFDLIEASNGTTIEVRDIFFNLPARLKFLKTDLKEGNLIQDVVEKLAISNPNISFELKRDGKKILQTYKTFNKKDTLYNIFGKDFCNNLIDLNFKDSYIEIEGFISTPESCKSYRSIQYIFVNSRYIKSKAISNTIENSYEGTIVNGKYPYFIIYLKLPYENIDVNVHPNKTEIKFLKEKEILEKLSFAVRQAIFKKNNNFLLKEDLEEINLNSNVFEESFEFNTHKEPYKTNKNEIEEDILKNFKYLSKAKIRKKETNLTPKQEEMFQSIVTEKPNEIKNKESSMFHEKNLQEKDKEEKLKFNVSKLRIIGEIFKLYILAEYEENFIIIDKHAAHEKIIYENLKKEQNENLKRQILISPIKILLESNKDCELVLNNIKIFLKFGFLIEHFEGRFILIREIPLILSQENTKEVFENILMKIKNNKKDLTPEKLNSLYSFIACKSAIKQNQINTTFELQNLAEKVYFNPNIRNCPHARPVMFVFEKERFDKKFGRK